MCIRFFGAYLLAGILLLLPICYSDKGMNISGCPLAATLSHGASFLVLERGGSPYGNPNIINIENFAPTLLDTSPTSPGQQFTSEDGVFNICTRVLGGGSVLNARFYKRASTHYIREVDWNQRMVDQSYEWVEKVVAFEPEIFQWESAFRDGLLEVGHLYGTKVGGTIFYADGHRHTAPDLLQYADLERSLFICMQLCKKCCLDTFPELKEEWNRLISRCDWKHLLMLSGVGPAFHFRAHGIKVIADCPMVGQGMADNPMNILLIPSPQPVEVSLVQVPILLGSHIQVLTVRLTVDTVNEIVNKTLRAGVILEKIMGPLSRGHLALRNTNPNDNSFVTFNYFKEPEDLRKCIEGMKTIIDVVNSDAYSKFRYKYMPVEALIDLMLALPLNRRRKHANVTFSLEQFCIDTVLTICHYHGGCRVGRVVDKGYRVPGIDSLRVVDGSTFYRTPGTHMGQRILHDGLLRGSKKKN
ncbi:unnamed protein product [Malus baccata var. baccata]